MRTEPQPVHPTPLRHNRDFLLLWTGQGISEFGSQVSALSLTLLVLDMTGSASQAGLVAFVSAATCFVLRMPAGALADRWHRRALMVSCETGRALALGSVAVALLGGFTSFPHILLVAFVEAALAVCFSPAQVGALRHVVPRDQLGDAVARNQACSQVLGVLGQPASGLLYGVGRAVPFLVDAVSYLVSLIGICLVKSRFQEVCPEPDQRHFWRESCDGMTWLWRRRFLRNTMLWLAALGAVYQAIGLVSLVVARNLGSSPFDIGVLFALCSAGGVAGAWTTPWLRRKLTPRATLLACGWTATVVSPFIAVVCSPIAIGLLGAAAFFFLPMVNAVVLTETITHAPAGIQGRVSSAARQLTTAAIPLGPLAAGALLSGVGDTATILMCTSAMALLAGTATVARWARLAPHAEPNNTGGADHDRKGSGVSATRTGRPGYRRRNGGAADHEIDGDP